MMLIVLSHIIGKSFDFGGECGVAFFFVLSGFVLSLAYGPRIHNGTFHTGPFVRRQLLKFYPLHLLTAAAILAMDARLGEYVEWYRLLPNLLLLQSWIPIDRFFFVANGSSWFLCNILFYYIIFRWLFLHLTNASTKKLSAEAFIILTLYVLLTNTVPDEKVNAILYTSPIVRLIDFSLGILLCRAYRSMSTQSLRTWLQSRSLPTATIIEAAAVAVVVITALAYPSVSPRVRCASLYWPLAFSVIFLFAVDDVRGGLITRWLQLPWMQWLGSISFEVYLLHMIVMRLSQSTYLLLGHDDLLPLGWSIAINVPLIIVSSWLVKKYFVDKVYGKLKNHVI